MRFSATITAAFLVCAALSRAVNADSVVAADGSGDFRTVQEALMATPPGVDAAHPWIIHIKPGTYHEIVHAQREKRFVTLRGEDVTNTTISYELNASVKGPDGKPIGTFNTPTVTIDADDFAIENLSLVNSAGATGQALALRVDGDRCVLRRCRFIGWQDTILVNRGRQYFEDCTIAGCTDFIFGGATAFFERCDIHILGNGYITAASTPDVQKFGLVLSHCRIIGDRPGVKTFLGRPWRAYASTVWLNAQMDDVVTPAGWRHWNETNGSARYFEFHSTGPGADTTQRVDWSKQLTETQAAEYAMNNVLAGSDGWKPAASEPTAPPPPMPATLPFPLPDIRTSHRGATTRSAARPGETTASPAATQSSSAAPLGSMTR